MLGAGQPGGETRNCDVEAGRQPAPLPGRGDLPARSGRPRGAPHRRRRRATCCACPWAPPPARCAACCARPAGPAPRPSWCACRRREQVVPRAPVRRPRGVPGRRPREEDVAPRRGRGAGPVCTSGAWNGSAGALGAWLDGLSAAPLRRGAAPATTPGAPPAGRPCWPAPRSPCPSPAARSWPGAPAASGPPPRRRRTASRRRPAPPPLAGRTLLAGPTPCGRSPRPAPARRRWSCWTGPGACGACDGAGGAACSASPGRRPGRPPAPAWLARAEDGLLWLDAQRAPVGAGETARPRPAPCPCETPPGWQRPVGLASFGGQLYVLDAGDGAGAGSGLALRRRRRRGLRRPAPALGAGSQRLPAQRHRLRRRRRPVGRAGRRRRWCAWSTAGAGALRRGPARRPHRARRGRRQRARLPSLYVYDAGAGACCS